MSESEVIIVNNTPPRIYADIIKESVMYALISLPFTVNRMNLEDLNSRIENIAKGKIAERLFRFFCSENLIPADFKQCTTPFYQVDRRDFILNGLEWDIKNNYIYHSGNELKEFNYTDLPALVPDRNPNDQWEKREVSYFGKSSSVCYLFTYLKASNRDKRDPFFKINLSKSQQKFLINLIDNYKGETFKEPPFEEDWFWKEMKKRKDEEQSLEIFDFPNLVITGYADETTCPKFLSTNCTKTHFMDYLQPQWYQLIKGKKGQLLKFMDGTLWTKIRNATLPVSRMPSFLSITPKLNEKIYIGYRKPVF